MERQNDICQLRKKVHTTHWGLKVGRTSSIVYEKAERLIIIFILKRQVQNDLCRESIYTEVQTFI